jgi:1-acyl-sn-glycerol-3-phosphate acyltransferase
LNIKVDVRGRRGPVSGKFIVSNHLSYVDVLILSRELPSLFITSTEIRDTFFLGRICKLAGCFFVERRREKRNLSTKESELKLMRDKFEQGFNIFLFPEGTSSDGQKVLPFKGTFFQLAVDTNTPVQPICLKYIGVNADFVPWYGNMTFPDHLFNLCLQDHIIASVEILDTIEGHGKMKLARISQSNISEAYA